MHAFDSGKILRLAAMFSGAVLTGVALTGYKEIPTKGERAARQDLKAVADSFRPQNQRRVLPTLRTNAGPSSFLAFAILNQPLVEAAYFDWAASVQAITVERARPDSRPGDPRFLGATINAVNLRTRRSQQQQTKAQPVERKTKL